MPTVLQQEVHMNIRICRVASIALILGVGFLFGCEEDTVEAEDATAQEQVEEQSGGIDEAGQTTTSREISESDLARIRTPGEAAPPLPIPLDPTEPTQLVAEGVLPPRELVVATNLLVVGGLPPNAD
jgi:hypothetical protein